jgi:hypothetical protein
MRRALSLLGWSLAVAVQGCAPRAVPEQGSTVASQTAPLAATDPGHDLGSSFLFDDDAPLKSYRIEVTPEDWAWLNSHATDETYVPARVLFEGHAWENASVRFKGSYGTLYSCFDAAGNRTCPKLSMKVSFNETDTDGRFFGLRKLIFNSNNRDPSALHERLAYSTFRAAGLIAPRAVHALVQVNDQPAGLYLLVENVDKEFVQDHFAETDGNLYKEAWPVSTDPNSYLATLQTNKATPDTHRLADFAAVLPGLTPETFNSAVDPWISRATMTRYLAVDLFLHDWDGIARMYCGVDATDRSQCGNHNFYLYDDPLTNRFVVIPWDQDHSFEGVETDLGRSWWDLSPEACTVQVVNDWIGILAAQCDPLLRGLMLYNWQAYLDTLEQYTGEGGLLSQAVLQGRLDKYRAQILEAVEADPNGPSPTEWRKAASRLRETLAAQVVEAQALLVWAHP